MSKTSSSSRVSLSQLRDHNLLLLTEETSSRPEPRHECVRCSYATGTKNAVGTGSTLDSGAATRKPGPAYIARGFHSISSSVSMSSSPLPAVLLLSPSSTSRWWWSACGGRRRSLCTSQRSADDVARLISHLLQLLTREDVPEHGDNDDDKAGLAAFLCASHLSTESARPGLGGGAEVALFRGDDDPCTTRIFSLLLTLSAERGPDGEVPRSRRLRVLCWQSGSSCARPTSRRSRRGWASAWRAALGGWRRRRTGTGTAASGAAATSSTWAGSGAAPGEPRVPWPGGRGRQGSPWIEDGDADTKWQRSGRQCEARW